MPCANCKNEIDLSQQFTIILHEHISVYTILNFCSLKCEIEYLKKKYPELTKDI